MRESYRLEIPAVLSAGSDAVAAVLAWMQVQGYRPEVIRPWRLPLAEAVTNAILHGCQGRKEAVVRIAAEVMAQGAEVGVHDPGRYAPGPEAAQLGDDLLAEGGRGGFLIAQGTDRFEHRNDADGHTLVLRWHTPPGRRTPLAALAQADQALDDLALQLGDAYESITAYAGFANLLATSGDFAEVLREVRGRLAQAVGHDFEMLRWCEGDAWVAAAPAPGMPAAIPRDSAVVEARVGASRQCVALATGSCLGADDPLASVRGPVVIVAIGCPKKSRGTLALMRKPGAPAFSAGQIAFVQSAADFLGAAQNFAEFRGQREEQIRLEQELQVAARIQQQLFPQESPSLAGWSVTGACQPSSAMGGDYFDWVVREDGTCLVLVADVMGKGMPAALVATILRSTWRTLAQRSSGPGSLLTELNAHLVRDLAALEVFITALLVELAPHTDRVRFANAGHGGLRQSARGVAAPRSHAGGGLPLGISPVAAYEDLTISVGRGDTLFAFTDGCYEFDRHRGLEAGRAVFEAELEAALAGDPGRLVPTVLERLQAHAPGGLPDDCTLVAMRFLP
jgi:serine phosphatase RsbU (regulator of sigma subunit)/anti-sigma regulatory factor (Ser/Thr protein kinase)